MVPSDGDDATVKAKDLKLGTWVMCSDLVAKRVIGMRWIPVEQQEVLAISFHPDKAVACEEPVVLSKGHPAKAMRRGGMCRRGVRQEVMSCRPGAKSHSAPDLFVAFLDGNSQWDASQSSSEAEAEVPLSFGEQLVLETYLRFRGRRYDRQRQEELCQPRRIKPPADRWSSGRREVLEKEQLEDLLKRLAGPKRGKATDSGELIALHSSKQEMVQRRVQAKDVEATFARLSAPKTARGYDPTPGEKVCLMYNQTSHRSVNLERLADMAQPKKRGGDLTEQLQQRSSCDDSEGVVSMSSAVATPKTIFLIGA
eukprot:s123_g27.t2